MDNSIQTVLKAIEMYERKVFTKSETLRNLIDGAALIGVPKLITLVPHEMLPMLREHTLAFTAENRIRINAPPPPDGLHDAVEELKKWFREHPID